MARVSHWRVQDDGCLARCFDTIPNWVRERRRSCLSRPLTGRWTRGGSALCALDARPACPRGRAGIVLRRTFCLRRRACSRSPATTHWLFANAFRDRFPTSARSDKIVIEDGDIITAGGLMAWTDLGMRLVDRLFGPTVTVETGRFLLIDPAGTRAAALFQFSPRLNHGDEAILKVSIGCRRARPAPSVSRTMAKVVAMEERNVLAPFQGGDRYEADRICAASARRQGA